MLGLLLALSFPVALAQAPTQAPPAPATSAAASTTASSEGSAWLTKTDAASNRGKDAHLVLSVRAIAPDGTAAERTLEIWQKGTDKRLVRLTAPARVAGTALLVPDGQTLYLYLPAYGKTRRVVGQQQGDAFLGTDFSLEDLSRLSYAKDFTAVVEATEAGSVRLLLTPKDPTAHREAHLRLWLRTADALPTRVEALNASGQVIRRVEFSDFRAVAAAGGSRTMAHSLVVTDLTAQRRTEATLTRATLDAGLSDSLFSVASLAVQ